MFRKIPNDNLLMISQIVDAHSMLINIIIIIAITIVIIFMITIIIIKTLR